MNPVYDISLTGDGDPIEVLQTNQFPNVGEFFFLFVAKLNYSNLILSIRIYSYDYATNTWFYEHIPGSPFKLGVETMAPSLYCLYLDMLYVGFGFTSLTHVYILPQTVTAGVSFTSQVSPRNVFDNNLIPMIETIPELFLFDFVPLGDDVCVCNSRTSKYCKHFSGDRAACLKNKQCRWTGLDHSSGSNLNSCLPCASEAC